MNENYKHHIMQGDAKSNVNSVFAPESLSNLFFWEKGAKMNNSTYFFPENLGQSGNLSGN